MEMEKEIYTQDFYKWQQEGSKRSALEVIPLVLELIKPKSVVDIGCGVGTWLAVFKKLGIEDCFGIDGDYVDQTMLQISPSEFFSYDLKKPIEINRKFDLVVSLEVAEHLPGEYAENFVNSLTKLGNIILFSAAIPFQGGPGHFNEQWPDYWGRLFANNGFITVDCLRSQLWNNENVEVWYRQNTIIFVQENSLESYPLLTKQILNKNQLPMSIIHPKIYEHMIMFYEKKLEMLKEVEELAALFITNEQDHNS